ncbi:MAG: hypothetical protein CO073_00785 [Candidatus Komeilibacteria bacterium CG_4_9_14_0_8_um_filter_36_9]|uniref:Type II toxin-antitoxin system RelE/ParE family toxin n=1 Tax=Candidatus Komeilibacteria bacterium CG_4_9_14_0_8_um_filter_36_9 TaxID=1974473 RepID=A0A2M8DS87_9BACT|nr:MAG: hypothetical protein CO073_00785 [Candidatus Komeilibacteria bacterium CG_4_9_14_0_8_um_filter_36_9]
MSALDRVRLLEIVGKLLKNDVATLNIIKIKNTDFLRLRCGRFRIIFHQENKQIIVDSIKLRNENTYKDL